MTGVVLRAGTFEQWREAARPHLLRKTPPEDLVWQSAEDCSQFLFEPEPPIPDRGGTLKLPKAFMEMAGEVARHRSADRWTLLYRAAWRLLNETRNLLFIETDSDVRALAMLRKDVQRDTYKMRAFVRFRKIEHDGVDQYVAWYRPEHRTLDANEHFFVNRFGGMRWAILTPETSMHWDLEQIRYGPGVPRSQAPAEDEFEDLWRAYYASIYNPTRLNLDAMRAQLPVRRWLDLPESRAIPELVRLSPGQLDRMTGAQPRSASAWIPADAGLSEIRSSIGSCSACELCGRATQPVPGEGPPQAKIMLVGEQPGDEEDRTGHPFVGPAGQVLDAALKQAGIERGDVFLTNSVKAFRFEERGKRRIHQTPRSLHISTCRPWLEAEISAVQPRVIVCLGATAGQSVLGRAVRIGAERGQPARHPSGAQVVLTYHPSAILRSPDEATRLQVEQSLVEDLQAAAALTLG